MQVSPYDLLKRRANIPQWMDIYNLTIDSAELTLSGKVGECLSFYRLWSLVFQRAYFLTVVTQQPTRAQ
jgi:hypothetical protein